MMEKRLFINLSEQIYEKYIDVLKNFQVQIDRDKGFKYLLNCYSEIVKNKNLKELNKYNQIKKDKQYVYFIDERLYNSTIKYINTFYKGITYNNFIRYLMYAICEDSDYEFMNNLIKNNNKKRTKIICNFPNNVLEIQLSDDEYKKIKNDIDVFCDKHKYKYFNNYDKEYVFYVFSNLYKMLYKTQYSMTEISKCFNRSKRTIEKWIQSLNWQLDLCEMQKRASNRLRDYKQIRNNSKKTMLRYNGSCIEEHIRQLFNLKLSNIFPEVIVGVNNTSILNNGKEIDIPIIIFKNNNCYKFAIEVNGCYWHQNKTKDIYKKQLILEKGYNPFYVIVGTNTTTQQEFEAIEKQINDIINKIIDICDN